jgi:hypothetical protein
MGTAESSREFSLDRNADAAYSIQHIRFRLMQDITKSIAGPGVVAIAIISSSVIGLAFAGILGMVTDFLAPTGTATDDCTFFWQWVQGIRDAGSVSV